MNIKLLKLHKLILELQPLRVWGPGTVADFAQLVIKCIQIIIIHFDILKKLTIKYEKIL